MTVDELLRRFEQVRRAGAGWIARCPAHDDRQASLSIGAGSDGRVLLNCHAGCKPDRVADALGVQLKDLFADEPRKAKEPEARYGYHDEKGKLLFEVLRFPGKDFRQRKPDGAGGWEWKLGDVRRVLYRLPEIVASAADERVVIVVEGEKDADALAKLGFVATSSSGGAEKWRKEYAESLRGRDVVVIPDNDEPGRRHAQQVARSLEGVSLRTRVIELPGLPPKGDTSDWLRGKEKPVAELTKLVSLAPTWEPGQAVESTSCGFVSSSVRVGGLLARVSERARSSQPFRVDFLDDIAIGILETDLIVLGAPTGAGKTTLAATFAQQAAAKGARVDYFALEAHEDEIEQRMLFRIMSGLAWERGIASHADLEMFTYARWCHGRCDGLVAKVSADATAELSGKTRTLRTFYRDGEFKTDDLVRMIRESRGAADLIILDHLHFLDDGDEDEVRAMSRRVKSVADAIQDAKTPVIAIAHLRKTDTKSKRVIPHIAEFHGSSEITKIATKVITLAPVEERPRSKPYFADTYMHVSKDRLKGEENATGILKFDLRSNTYAAGYELGRLTKGGSAWEEIPIVELPRWAEHEDRRRYL